MDRDRYFVERCKNLPRKQRQTILLLEYRVQIFYLKAEDYPYPNERVRVVNFTVQTQRKHCVKLYYRDWFSNPRYTQPGNNQGL